MNDEQLDIIDKTKEYIKKVFKNDTTGHDYYHTKRVYNMANKLQSTEGGDLFIISLASLLHDVCDIKLDLVNNDYHSFLKSMNVEQNIIDKVSYIIDNQSYRKSIRKLEKINILEGQIVQDADRLDCMGAIAIARTFMYSGAKKRALYEPSKKIETYNTEEEYNNNTNSAIHHFYDKLLKLKDLINTESAKKIAKKRHKFLELYLEEFYLEWNGE